MKNDIISSGIGIVGNIPWGTHFSQFYQTKEDLIEIIIPYFRAGLENNEFCIWVTSESFELEDAKRILEKYVPDFNACLKRGQIEIIPYSNWFLKEGVFNSERILAGYLKMLNQALDDGYNGLRVVEDTSWLGKEYWNYFVDYEGKLDFLISSHEMIVLHPYCLGIINGIETIDLISRHQISLIKEKGKWKRIENPMQKDEAECKPAEEALRESEARFRSYFEMPLVGVLITSLDKGIISVNDKFCTLVGYSADELKGKTWDKITHPENLARDVEQFNQVLAGEIDSYTLEKRFIHKNGTSIPTILSVGCVRHLDYTVNYLVATVQDITERKKAEEELRKSENRFRVMFEDHGAPMLLIEPNSGQIIDANEAAARFYEYSRKQLRAMCIDQINQLPPEEIAAERHKAVEHSKNVFVFTHRLASGDVRLVEVYSSPVIIQGQAMLFSIIHDITQRKKAEEALQKAHETLEEKVKERTADLKKAYNSLKESEESLAEAQKIAHVGNWERNFATNKFLWSDEMYRIFGLKPQELEVTYGLFLSYVHSDDRDRINNAVKRALSGESLDIDFRIILANGEERIVCAKGEVIFEDKNAPVLIRGTTQDITERKRVEEALNQVTEHERFLADVVEKANMPFGVGLPDGKLLMFNQAFADLLGYGRGELIKKHWAFDLTPPEWHKYEAMRLNEAIRTRKPVRYEKEYFRKNGTCVPVELFVHPVFDAEGNLLNYRTFITDITERKKAEENLKSSEERYRSFIQNFKGIAFQIDEKFNLEFLHGAVKEITGYNEDDLSSDISWRQLVVPEDMDIYLNKEKEAAHAPGEYKGEFDYRIRTKDGKIKWMHEIHQKLSQKNGKSVKYIGMIYDITDKKEAEDFLAKIEIVRQKEIHHRIKNNLQVISSLLDLQAEKFKNREYVDYSEILAAFNESQDRVMSIALIHEELHESKETDKLNFSLYLNRLADNLFQTYRLESANVSLNLDIEENIFFDMDTAVPLGMIVNEIISNSFKYAFAGRNKGEIQIKLHRREDIKDGNQGYVLNISDNGIGIPEKIDFKNPETLGLQLVNILVDQVDGEFELKRNNGTEFIIRFTVKER